MKKNKDNEERFQTLECADRFKKLFQQEFLQDNEYDAYLSVWLEYHRRCESFDRMLSKDGMPKDHQDRASMSRHSRLVKKNTTDLVPRPIDQDKWFRARDEAVRIVEREYK